MIGSVRFFLVPYLLLIPTLAAEEEMLHSMSKRSDDTSALATVVENLSQQVGSLKALVQQQASTISALTVSMKKGQTSIAFHAEFSGDNIPLGPYATLILNNVVTNVGGGYDKLTGHFTAKVAGTYLIQVHYMGELNEQLYIHIFVDDVDTEYSISRGVGAWDHASESLVLHLNAGQRVYLKHGSNDTRKIRGGHWTTFSGLLIQADA